MTSQYIKSLWKHHRIRFHYRRQDIQRRTFCPLMGLRGVQKSANHGLQRPSLLHPSMMAGDASPSISQSSGVLFAGGYLSSDSDPDMVLQCSNSKFSSLWRQNTENICPERRFTTLEMCSFVSNQESKNDIVDFSHGLYSARGPRQHAGTPLDHPPFQQMSHLCGWIISTTSLGIFESQM